MRHAGERIASRYAALSEGQRAQVRKFYGTFGGRGLLDVIGPV
jgi:hypothetical protein